MRGGSRQEGPGRSEDAATGPRSKRTNRAEASGGPTGGRFSGGGRSAHEQDTFGYGSERRPLDDEDERVVRRYYPIFENLVLFFLNSRRWLRNFRNYVREETRYRGRLLVQSGVILVVALTFVAGTGAMVVLGFFFLFRELTGSAWAAAFLNGLLALLFSGGLFFFLAGTLQRLSEFDRYQDDEPSPSVRRRRARMRAEEPD